MVMEAAQSHALECDALREAASNSDGLAYVHHSLDRSVWTDHHGRLSLLSCISTSLHANLSACAHFLASHLAFASSLPACHV